MSRPEQPNLRTKLRGLRIGIFGAGLMGRWHADAARRAGATVQIICDPVLERATVLAQRYDAQATNDAESAMRQCDVAHICSPLASHYALCTSALENGRAVICEKPVADSLALTMTLVEEAARQRLVFVPTHQFVLQQGVRRAILALPSLGTLRHVDGVICTAGATGRSPEETEQIALDILPHPLSLFERIRPGVLNSIQWSGEHRVRGEIRAMASDGTISLNILISCTGRPPVNRLRLIADGGTVSIDLFHGFAMVDRSMASRWQKIRQPFTESILGFAAASANLSRRLGGREWAYPGLRNLVATTYAAVLGVGEPPFATAEIVAVARACEQIRLLRVGSWGGSRDL